MVVDDRGEFTSYFIFKHHMVSRSKGKTALQTYIFNGRPHLAGHIFCTVRILSDILLLWWPLPRSILAFIFRIHVSLTSPIHFFHSRIQFSHLLLSFKRIKSEWWADIFQGRFDLLHTNSEDLNVIEWFSRDRESKSNNFRANEYRIEIKLIWYKKRNEKNKTK